MAHRVPIVAVKHIRRIDNPGLPVCGNMMVGVDVLVEAAMQSSCDDCRVHPSINVGRVNDVRLDGRGKLGVQPETPMYEPQPWPVKTLEEERRERFSAAPVNFTLTVKASKKPTKRGEKK